MTPREPHDTHVVIMGGGVAGLTAAHELVERGFRVTLCERRNLPGGKSRSYKTQPLDDSGTPLEKSQVGQVPAEHGFRFFPGFYHHLDETMSRIPLPDDKGKHVIDCLVPIREELFGVTGRAPLHVSVSARKVRDIRGLFRFPESLLEVGLTRDDLRIFASKLWQIATSCPERRNDEYERIGWRQFVESLDRSDEYYWYLASGLTRALVAARAKKASTKTMGNVALKLLMSLSEGTQTMDRVLNGPTNEVWFDPWVQHLRDLGGSRFEIKFATKVMGIRVRGDRIDSVTTCKLDWSGKDPRPTKETEDLRADFFIAALSADNLAELIQDQNNEPFKRAGNKPFASGERQFDKIVDLARPEGDHLQWMSGLQIYLKNDEPINPGHQLFLDSPWGLTSISQAQFWNKDKGYLPKGVGGVLSIDVSSWELEGFNNKEAKKCRNVDIYSEVKAEIRAALGAQAPRDANIVGWHLDDSIVGPNFAGKSGDSVEHANLEPVLVNHANSWELRPTANTALANLFIAGDFVRTTTDLACMEGANEAARLAVNALLDDYPDERKCWLAKPAEPLLLKPLQQMDAYRYERGLPWSGIDLGQWIVAGSQAATVLGDLTFGAVSPAGPPPDGDAGSAEAPTSKGSAGTKIDAKLPFHLPRSKWDEGAKRVVEVKALTPAEVEQLRSNKYARPGRADPMFKRWRLSELDLGRKRYLVPFHAYEADGLIIHGKANNFAFLEQATRGTPYRPVYSVIGGSRVGYAELWIIDYADTIGGPYSEVVINFVVRKDESREYHWRSPYSSIVPMNDSANRLFTPRLLLHERAQGERGVADHGPIEYGRELLGFDKQKATIELRRENGFKIFKCSQDGVESLSGRVDETERFFQTIADTTELARELGTIELAKNVRQARNGEELAGGLITRDFRQRGGEGPDTVEVLATYKFAPKISVLEPRNPEVLRYNPQSPFGELLAKMDFEYTIATRDPHLKSVLHLEDWPSPDDR